MIEVSQIDVRILREKATKHTFELLKDVSVHLPDHGQTFVVPAGFVTNFASAPRFLWSIVAPLDITVASLVHDYLYSKKGHQKYKLNRKQADKVLRDIVKVTCNASTAWACYRAVRLCGSRYFCVE